MQRIQIVSLRQVKEKNLMVENKEIKSPKDAAEIFIKYLDNPDREYLVFMGLDTKNKVNVIETVSIGTLNSSLVHPREVFKNAIISNCSAIIVGHNHPSGDSSQPSREDITVTKRLVEAGKILGIDVLDHIIIGDNSFLSLKERGHIS